MLFGKTLICISAGLLLVAACDSKRNEKAAGSGSSENDASGKKTITAENDWPLQCTFELDREKCVTGTFEDVFLLVKYSVPEQPVDSHSVRPGINLSLVLDRSGSMEEQNKIGFVQNAAGYVVDKMVDRDKLGIVEYDDAITQLWPLSEVKSVSIVKDLIKSLYPRGSTNLCGGLMAGVDQIRGAIDTGKVNRIILLSDGLTNTGITSTLEISKLVRNARQCGLTVSTMGVGLDYNEDLLQSIAECGGGKYYYIENPVQIEEIFREELHSLFKTVASNITVEFNGNECVDSIVVFGYEATLNKSRALTSLGNGYSGGKGVMLMKLRTRLNKTGMQSIGNLAFSFYDCVTKQKRVQDIKFSITGVNDSLEADKSINKGAIAEASLIVADNEHEEYVREFERGDKVLAQQNLAILQQKMETLNKDLSDIRIKKKIASIQMEKEEMETAEKSESNRQIYIKSSKQRFYYAKKGDRAKYLMQEGDSNYDVKKLQKKLNDLKVYNGEIDGKFDDSVKVAVEKYQSDNGIEVDGVAGPEMLKKLGLY